MRRPAVIAAASAALFVAGAGAALAHPPILGALEGHMAFAAGLLHPLTGVDHLLAMVAVGLWAGLTGGRAVLIWPAAFVGLMLVGGALGLAAVPLPMVEGAILASLVVLGLLLLSGAAVPLTPGALLVALFALAHGWAHGAEMPPEAAVAAYAAGFALATAALHVCGLVLAYAARGASGRRLVRGAGGLIALTGIVLAVV
jgi:urease accessory protein